MPFANWDVTRRELDHALESLADGEFLVLGEPVLAARHRPEPHPVRYVQVLRVDDVLTAECVGSTSMGGSWEMEGATVEELRTLGWLTPHECADQHGHQTPNFLLCVERSSRPALSRLLVKSLAALEVGPPELELETPGS